MLMRKSRVGQVISKLGRRPQGLITRLALSDQIRPACSVPQGERFRTSSREILSFKPRDTVIQAERYCHSSREILSFKPRDTVIQAESFQINPCNLKDLRHIFDCAMY